MKNLELEYGMSAGLGVGKKKKAAKKKRGTWTVEPPDDLRERVALAIEATGSDRSELLLRCVREELDAVVAQIIAERKRAVEVYEKKQAASGERPGKAE